MCVGVGTRHRAAWRCGAGDSPRRRVTRAPLNTEPRRLSALHLSHSHKDCPDHHYHTSYPPAPHSVIQHVSLLCWATSLYPAVSGGQVRGYPGRGIECTASVGSLVAPRWNSILFMFRRENFYYCLSGQQ